MEEVIEDSPAVVLNKTFLIACSVLSVFGALACGLCARHFYTTLRRGANRNKRQRQRKSIAMLLFMDSFVSCLACVCQALVLMSLVLIKFAPTKILCTMIMLPCFCACFFGTAFMSAVATVRYATLNVDCNNEAKKSCYKNIFKEANSTILVCVLTAMLAALAFASCGLLYGLDVPVSLLSEMCYKHPDMSQSLHILVTSVPVMTVTAMTLISLYLDLSLLRLLRTRVMATTASSIALASFDRSGYLRVPVRSTLFSAGTMLPLLAVIALKFHPAMVERMAASAHILLAVGVCYTVFRAPLAAMLTFRWRRTHNRKRNKKNSVPRPSGVLRSQASVMSAGNDDLENGQAIKMSSPTKLIRVTTSSTKRQNQTTAFAVKTDAILVAGDGDIENCDELSSRPTAGTSV